MKKKIVNIPYANSKVVDLFGNYYMKEMSEQEVEEKWHLLCIEKPDIRTHE